MNVFPHIHGYENVNTHMGQSVHIWDKSSHVPVRKTWKIYKSEWQTL